VGVLKKRLTKDYILTLCSLYFITFSTTSLMLVTANLANGKPNIIFVCHAQEKLSIFIYFAYANVLAEFL